MKDKLTFHKIFKSALEYILGFVYIGTSLSLIALGLSQEDLSCISSQYFLGNRILVLIAGIAMFVVPYLIWNKGRTKK